MSSKICSHGLGLIATLTAVRALAFLDRLGRYEAAATIAGFAFSPLTAAAIPEITTAIAHLRDVLGDQTYESLARKGSPGCSRRSHWAICCGDQSSSSLSLTTPRNFVFAASLLTFGRRALSNAAASAANAR
jgi:hypothetical protein